MTGCAEFDATDMTRQRPRGGARMGSDEPVSAKKRGPDELPAELGPTEKANLVADEEDDEHMIELCRSGFVTTEVEPEVADWLLRPGDLEVPN